MCSPSGVSGPPFLNGLVMIITYDELKTRDKLTNGEILELIDKDNLNVTKADLADACGIAAPSLSYHLEKGANETMPEKYQDPIIDLLIDAWEQKRFDENPDIDDGFKQSDHEFPDQDQDPDQDPDPADQQDPADHTADASQYKDVLDSINKPALETPDGPFFSQKRTDYPDQGFDTPVVINVFGPTKLKSKSSFEPKFNGIKKHVIELSPTEPDDEYSSIGEAVDLALQMNATVVIGLQIGTVKIKPGYDDGN